MFDHPLAKKYYERGIVVDCWHFTPISGAQYAARMCTKTTEKAELSLTYQCPSEEAVNFLKKLLAKGHESVFEHIVYSFTIRGISRACLQQLARHRIASLSVESTRWTLGWLKGLYPFKAQAITPQHPAFRYLIPTGDEKVDIKNIKQLNSVIELLEHGLPDDVVKYALPESFRTSLMWTINCRSLRNFLRLRTAKRAMEEIRAVAYMVFITIPNSHQFLYEDVVAEGE